MSVPPVLRKVHTTVYRCGQCKTWYVRLPNWSALDHGDSCERCGCTSFITSEGRSVGPSSKHWYSLRGEFLEYVEMSVFHWASVDEMRGMFDVDDYTLVNGDISAERAV